MSIIHAAFADPPRDTQRVFRDVMEAMARPGHVIDVEISFTPPAPMNAVAAAVLLTLADFETPVWVDARDDEAREFLRFHTGARVIDDHATATFALLANPRNAPALRTFAQGTPDYPDRSATIIMQVADFGWDWRLTGPGIHGETRFSTRPLPEDLITQWRDNQARFPQGVDVIFAGNGRIAAVPRSTEIVEAG